MPAFILQRSVSLCCISVVHAGRSWDVLMFKHVLICNICEVALALRRLRLHVEFSGDLGQKEFFKK